MNLMRWLVVGSSLGKIRDDRHRYKMAEQGLLPRFGSMTHREANKMAAESEPAKASPEAKLVSRNSLPGDRPHRAVRIIGANERNSMTTATADSAVIGISPALQADDTGAEERTKAIPERAAKADRVGDIAGRDASTDTPQGTAGHRFPLGRWTMFRNPFVRKAKLAASARTPVQGELWLDLVKPVRNDLTDSDVEVVAAPAPAAPVVPAPASRLPSLSIDPTANGAEESVSEPASERISEPVSPSSEPVWSRLKTQFFGAEKG